MGKIRTLRAQTQTAGSGNGNWVNFFPEREIVFRVIKVLRLQSHILEAGHSTGVAGSMGRPERSVTLNGRCPSADSLNLVGSLICENAKWIE